MLDNLSIQLTNALFRIATAIKTKDLKSRIESWSIALLESASALDHSEALKAARVLEKLVVFGESIGDVAYVNAKVIYEQLNNLKAVLANNIPNSPDDLRVDDIFKSTIGNGSTGSPFNGSTGSPFNIIGNNEAIGVAESGQYGNDIGNSKNGFKDRQLAIISIVQAQGKAAMKDLIAGLPNVSERTIRYDLQKLCDSGTVERIGNGGPASYYQMRQVLLSNLTN